MIRRYKVGYDVELHKRTVQRAMLSLIGPDAAVTSGADALAAAEEHANTPIQIDGVQALAVRTDVGVDLICEADRHRAAERGARRARRGRGLPNPPPRCLRVESGRPRFGVDMDDTTIPQEADLNERAVNFTKGCYVGQETVARLFYRGKPNRHLRGLRLSAPAAAGEELRLGERSVGRVGSSVTSPAFGPIALALVRREAEPGATIAVGGHGTTAVVVQLPFGV